MVGGVVLRDMAASKRNSCSHPFEDTISPNGTKACGRRSWIKESLDGYTGRRFLCPENRRGSKRKRVASAPQPRDEHHRRRLQRRKFLKGRTGKRLYARRGQTIEPFNDWFKGLFELDQKVWHRGLDNNRTQMLAAIFAYQLLVRYNHRRSNENGQVKWIMDCL